VFLKELYAAELALPLATVHHLLLADFRVRRAVLLAPLAKSRSVAVLPPVCSPVLSPIFLAPCRGTWVAEPPALSELAAAVWAVAVLSLRCPVRSIATVETDGVDGAIPVSLRDERPPARLANRSHRPLVVAPRQEPRCKLARDLKRAFRALLLEPASLERAFTAAIFFAARDIAAGETLSTKRLLTVKALVLDGLRPTVELTSIGIVARRRAESLAFTSWSKDNSAAVAFNGFCESARPPALFAAMQLPLSSAEQTCTSLACSILLSGIVAFGRFAAFF
jgi:hypothetical protein